MPPARLPHLLQQARKLPPQLLLAALVLIAAAGSAVVGLARGRATAPGAAGSARGAAPDPGDEDALLALPVEQAYTAARQGDLETYLAQFTDPARAQLAATRRDKGDAYLKDYLARLTGPLKGLAADLTRKQQLDPDSARLPFQFVYADHNESQAFIPRREG